MLSSDEKSVKSAAKIKMDQYLVTKITMIN